MVPFPLDRVPSGFRDIAEFYSWQHSGVQSVLDRSRREELVSEILSRLSPASSFDPVLLRWVRQTVSAASDAALESFVWQDKSLDSNQYSSAKNDRVGAKSGFREMFQSLDTKNKKAVLNLLRKSRAGLGEDPSLWFVELLSLDPKDLELVEDHNADLEDVRRAIRYFDDNRGDSKIGGTITNFLGWFSSRVESGGVWAQDRGICEVIRRWQREFHPKLKLHSGTRVGDVLPDGECHSLWLQSNVDGVSIHRKISDKKNAINSVLFEAEGRILEVHLPKHLIEKVRQQEFWESGEKPRWVSEYGTDQFGAWCEFQVLRHDGSRMVTQRLRWIPPGEFMMGSSNSELGRFNDEIQHSVRISHGYWLADTPVTQELWMAIENSNESRTKGEQNPVERVSWEDCYEWIKKLNSQVIHSDVFLPTEAQWEYACRAGSQNAYCFGNDEEKLTQYAWYDRNTNETTMPVKQLNSNLWGLFDIHGNVWEWCHDRKSEYSAEESQDPSGPDSGARRVIRGGSWSNKANELRAACRSSCHPGDRNSDIGFRFVISAFNSKPSRSATYFADSDRINSEPVLNPADKFWKSGTKPSWVSEYGIDVFGLWFEFSVPRRYGVGAVIQRMRWILPGIFVMGSPAGEPGRDSDEHQHSVQIRQGFWIAETQVTQELWAAITGDNPSYFKGDNNPVERVSLEDCNAWVGQLDQRLSTRGWGVPSETEWEYACRAGTQSVYSFGDDEVEIAKYAWYKQNANDQTHPVKQLLPNNWGLWDCHGNVSEWCMAVKLDTRSNSASTFARGGSYNESEITARAAYRRRILGGNRSQDVGFRIVYRGSDCVPDDAMIPEHFRQFQESRLQRQLDDDEYQFINSVDLKHLSSDGFREQSLFGSKFPVLRKNRMASTRVIDARCHGYQFDEVSQPSWAIDFGIDDHGVFAVFEVALTNVVGSSKFPELVHPIHQKMRWIPPGPFQMGSSGDGNKLNFRELRHPVLITHGYWIFDTPCTQGLWVAMMGENPSYFVDHERPVERVSWKDVRTFCLRLNRLFSTVDFFRLPTEAQWEYACRAGTQTSTYRPLDSIAWYEDNSSDGYDLNTSIPQVVDSVQNQPNRQKPRGTRKVGTKLPNAWGLYDMLGNVWEWCSDSFGYYKAHGKDSKTEVKNFEYHVDPSGPTGSSKRIIRGGSWNEPAKNIRAACRDSEYPHESDLDIGFRLVASNTTAISQ
jgi:formylglycine-generating enzyme required for sulfatase activity